MWKVIAQIWMIHVLDWNWSLVLQLKRDGVLVERGSNKFRIDDCWRQHAVRGNLFYPHSFMLMGSLLWLS